MIAYFKSDEYWERETAKRRQIAQGEVLLVKAFEQGIISEGEYWWLESTIALNSGLIVSPAMAERLRQVQE
ncbi:MAG TPA: hypothetical protein VKT25_07905 [Ktedonobacteraceae bacterium]|nr:hypothetical protein [Ktedonobacteraceae bacterium]